MQLTAEQRHTINYAVQSQQSMKIMKEVKLSLEECPNCYGGGMEAKGFYLQCNECGLILQTIHDSIQLIGGRNEA